MFITNTYMYLLNIMSLVHQPYLLKLKLYYLLILFYDMIKAEYKVLDASVLRALNHVRKAENKL